MTYEKKNPLITIIIPTYNREDTISRAIESVLSQTYENWELIIVDDGSTDNTLKIVEKYSNENKKIIYFSEKHLGVCNARNVGIKNSKGNYIAFLDSDDEFLPNKIKIQLELMIKHKADLSLSNCTIYQEDKKIEKKFNETKILSKNELFLDKITRSASVIMYNKEILSKLFFDNKFPTYNDLDFLLKAINQTQILFINQKLVNIYKTLKGNRISTNYKKKIEGTKKIIENLNNYHLNLNETDSLLNLMLLQQGLFLLLDKETKKGRKILKKMFKKYPLKSYLKIKILYLLSYSNFLLNLSLKLYTYLWKKGLAKY